jgi:hypothetical protein
MKRIFLLLCLVAGSANAGLRLDDGSTNSGKYLSWRNEFDVEYVLTYEKPDWCGGTHMMYNVSSKGTAFYGCWRVVDDRVHIQFREGLIRNYVFDFKNFRSK